MKASSAWMLFIGSRRSAGKVRSGIPQQPVRSLGPLGWGRAHDQGTVVFSPGPLGPSSSRAAWAIR